MIRRGAGAAALGLWLGLCGLHELTSQELAAAPTVVWRAPLPAGLAPPLGDPAVAGGRLFVVAGGLRAFDATTGAPLWTAKLERYEPRALVADATRLYVAEASVRALDAATGTERWRFEPAANTSLGRPTLAGGTLYVGASEGTIHALDPETGHERWRHRLAFVPEFPGVIRGLTATENSLFVALEQLGETGRQAGWLASLALKDGTVRWLQPLGPPDAKHGASASPLVVGTRVVVGDYASNRLHALDTPTGNRAWQLEGEPGFVGFPESPRFDGQTLFAASGDLHLYALDPDGRQRWKAPLPAAPEALTLCGPYAVVQFQGLAFHDRSTGERKARLLDQAEEFVSSGLAVDGTRLFVAGPKAVYAVECGVGGPTLDRG